ncbi:hypothetical protein F2Q68_00019732 [Brassica cretica]|uniref:NB-ARC domain-containing protein n=1 Tax=Brassica cretica TaxID=69181 RepID=A0A8S9FY39_BRACR|nr:hypothetical protein F2Q68_00019732 [Brassica cretica]
MGGCFSFGFSCDETLKWVFRCLTCEGYIRNLGDNLTDLRRQMEDLKATEDEVKNKVEREKRLHLQRRPAVGLWLTRVEDVRTRFNNLDSTSVAELENLCLCNLCSKNLCLSYKYGKMVFLLSEEVKNLKLEGNFEEVTVPALRSVVEVRSTRPTIGQEEMLKTAWDRLMENGVGIMGLHGMGGVGKTTLLKKIHNRFAEIDGRFDVVMWIVVSRGANISKLQDDIAQKLNLCGDEWTKKNESDKAAEIHRVLNENRFALMLDDIWEKVDLEDIGVPEPNRENGCKVAFTTRSREVCVRMGDREPMQVNCLEWDEAWELFEKKVGEDNLRRDPVIIKLARKVAEKCRGLPLALIVIGETMSTKTRVEEWEHAVDELNRSAAEYPDMETNILPILKFSYDSLRGENIKSCFLYCALFPEDYEIDRERLIEYWLSEGFLGEYPDAKRAINKGHDVLGTLINASLLTKVGTREVQMHDVLREMAIWIASYFWKLEDTYFVKARFGLHEIPKIKDWEAVRRMSLMGNNIKDITCHPKCTKLTTLFLQNNKLKKLSGEFIQFMQNLVVLDLFGNSDINELPEQISKLESLQYLDLSITNIEQLPVGLQELKNLYQLNLNGTWRLRSLAGISKLSSLRILKLLCSNVHADASLVRELQLLEHLQVLAITICAETDLDQIFDDQRLVNCINGLFINGFEQKPFDLSLLVSTKNLRELWVHRSHFLEISPTSPLFINLSKVRIIADNSIKDLTWLLFAPNLAILNVACAEEMQEIINEEKAANLTGITPFTKLEELTFSSLPKLESIYWSPLPFPVLRRLNIVVCPNLKRLPLNATSVPQIGKFRITMYPREQEADLTWEDEDTKNRFLPLLRSACCVVSHLDCIIDFTLQHVSVSLKLVAVFGTIVQSTVSARGSVCVDLHVEERLQICRSCSFLAAILHLLLEDSLSTEAPSGHRNPSFRVWNLKAMKPILYDSNRTFSENEARESEKDSSVVAVKIRGHGLALPEELMKIFFLASVEFIRTFDPLLQHKADKECNPFRAKSRELKTAHPENKAP